MTRRVTATIVSIALVAAVLIVIEVNSSRKRVSDAQERINSIIERGKHWDAVQRELGAPTVMAEAKLWLAENQGAPVEFTAIAQRASRVATYATAAYRCAVLIQVDGSVTHVQCFPQ